MTKTRIRLHRIVSWWLVVFSIVTIMLGYAISNRWIPNTIFYISLHNIFEWSFISLMLFHIVYTLIFVRLRTWKLLKHPFKHWVRLLQQLTKWAILAFVTLVILSGFTQYPWAAPALESWMPFRYHKFYDLFLVLSIIIHAMAGAKIFFNRKKLKRWWINVLILVIGGALIAVLLYFQIPNLIASL